MCEMQNDTYTLSLTTTDGLLIIHTEVKPVK